MAMAQKDRNTRMALRAFEMVDKVYGRSQKTGLPVSYVPRDEPAPRFNQNSYEYGGPKVYTVKEGTNTSCRRVIYQYSKEATTKEPVVSLPTEHIHQHLGGVRPHMGHANRFETPKKRAISCDEAVQLYGGVLIKEYRK